jgi:hypothetical protein
MGSVLFRLIDRLAAANECVKVLAVHVLAVAEFEQPAVTDLTGDDGGFEAPDADAELRRGVFDRAECWRGV